MSDRRRAIGGTVAIAALLVGGGAGALAAGPPAHGQMDRPAGVETGAAAGDTSAGEALYVAGCASCHGPQGQGTEVAPPIADAGAALTDYVLRTGRMPLAAPGEPGRRGPPLYDQPSIDAIVAYVASLGDGPPLPDVAVAGADLARGRQLFIANCASCHGAGGAGGAVGGGFVAPSLSEADPLTVAEAITAGPGAMPGFRFPPADVDALAAYVEYLRAPPSPGGLPVAEVGPVAEGFLAGSVGLVTLLALARWIARGRRDGNDPEGESGPPGEDAR